MKSPLKLRLIEYLHHKGYRKSNIEELAGVPKSLFSGAGMEQGISEIILFRIVNAFPDLNLNWWIRNEGEMLINSAKNTDCPGANSGQKAEKSTRSKTVMG